jgi:hypothetical protein
MRRLSLSFLALLILSGLLLAPGTSKAGAEAHPLIRRAVNALQAAKIDLQNASHDYCGHRVEALEATNAALNQLQQALQCDSRRRRSAGTEIESEPAPATVGGGERHPNIFRAVNALGAAEGDLQNAAHDYCGHRVEALGAVRGALNQLRLAIQCDKR